MSPLFGHKHEEEQAQEQAHVAALEEEVRRLDALPLPQLAAEVMVKGFGPGGPGADENETVSVEGPNITAGVSVPEIALEFAPGGTTRGADDRVRLWLHRLVAEGVQALEHASLVRAQMHTAMNGLDYALTRLGRTALERDAVERVLTQRSSDYTL